MDEIERWLDRECQSPAEEALGFRRTAHAPGIGEMLPAMHNTLA